MCWSDRNSPWRIRFYHGVKCVVSVFHCKLHGDGTLCYIHKVALVHLRCSLTCCSSLREQLHCSDATFQNRVTGSSLHFPSIFSKTGCIALQLFPHQFTLTQYFFTFLRMTLHKHKLQSSNSEFFDSRFPKLFICQDHSEANHSFSTSWQSHSSSPVVFF